MPNQIPLTKSQTLSVTSMTNFAFYKTFEINSPNFAWYSLCSSTRVALVTFPIDVTSRA